MRIAAPVCLTALLLLAACNKADEAAKPAPRPSLPVNVGPAPEANPATPGAPPPTAVDTTAPTTAPPATALTPTAPPATPTAALPPAPGATPPAPPVAASRPTHVAARAVDRFDLAGTEPFWNLQIRQDGLKLTRPGHSDVTAPNPGSDQFGKTALWNATVAQSRMTVTVTKAPCTDGMSDKAYAYSAKVELWGTTLSGCATRVQ